MFPRFYSGQFKIKIQELSHVCGPMKVAKTWGENVKVKAEAKLLTHENDSGWVWVYDRVYRKLEDGRSFAKYLKKTRGTKK